MSNFPERLKGLREEKGMYQKDLARSLGLSRSTVTAYEAGNREPDQATLNRIADLFQVSVDYLMGRTDYRLLAPEAKKSTGLDYKRPREWDRVLRETDITFNGSPLDDEEKEDMIEFIKAALRTLRKRNRK